MIEALIFDFDGLILDTEKSLVSAWREIYDEYDVEIPLSALAEILGQSADPVEIYLFLEQALGRSVERERLKQRRLKREMEILSGQGPMPGVLDLIHEALGCGLRLAVASSSEHAWVDHHLEQIGLIDSFETIACADDVAATKPAPDLYQLALQQLGLPPGAAIALEDSAHGVHAAQAAGIACIAVPNEITRHASFAHAPIVLETLAGVTLDDLLRLSSALPS